MTREGGESQLNAPSRTCFDQLLSLLCRLLDKSEFWILYWMNNKKTCIVLFCGIPASGKTTLIYRISDILSKKSFKSSTQNASAFNSSVPHLFDKSGSNCIFHDVKIHLILYDGLLSSLESRDTAKLSGEWKEFRRNVITAAEQYITVMCNFNNNLPPLSRESTMILNMIKDSNKHNQDNLSGDVFLVEDNMYYHSMRYEWFQIARKYCMGYHQIFLKCTSEVALNRNMQRENSLPKDVIMLMASKFEEPNPNKYYWEKSSLILESTDDIDKKIIAIFKVMNTACNNPVLPLNDDSLLKEEARDLCSRSLIHQVDNILRRLTGIKISKKKALGVHQSKEELQNYSKQLNMARQQVLLNFKQGNISLPFHLVEKVENGKMEEISLQLTDLIEQFLVNLTEQNKIQTTNK